MTITHPSGFRAAGSAVGLKPSGRPDLTLVVNDGPSDAVAAVSSTAVTRAATSADAAHAVRSTEPSVSRTEGAPSPSSRTRRTQRARRCHSGVRDESMTATSSPRRTPAPPSTAATSTS